MVLPYFKLWIVTLASTMLLGVPNGPETPVASSSTNKTALPAGVPPVQLRAVDQLSLAPAPLQITVAASKEFAASKLTNKMTVLNTFKDVFIARIGLC